MGNQQWHGTGLAIGTTRSDCSTTGVLDGAVACMEHGWMMSDCPVHSEKRIDASDFHVGSRLIGSVTTCFLQTIVLLPPPLLLCSLHA